MDSGLFVALSMGLTHGVAIGLGLRELWLLRRPDGRGGWKPERVPEPPPRPPTLGDRPLPDCLVPRPMTARRPVRVLEDA